MAQKKYPCPCCGKKTLEVERAYDICDICHWEDDEVQFVDPNYAGGANWLSLNKSRENFRKYGVIETEQDLKERREYYATHNTPDGRWLYDEEYLPETTIGTTPDEIREWLKANTAEHDLATALAQVHNRTIVANISFVGHDASDFPEMTAILEDWHALFEEVSEKVIHHTKSETASEQTKYNTQTEHELGYLYDTLRPFMEANGYVDDGGWWKKASEVDPEKKEQESEYWNRIKQLYDGDTTEASEVRKPTI